MEGREVLMDFIGGTGSLLYQSVYLAEDGCVGAAEVLPCGDD